MLGREQVTAGRIHAQADAPAGTPHGAQYAGAIRIESDREV
jgi:hypothetical protein